MGLLDADHQETSPDANTPVITKLSCSLNGQTQSIRILSNTLAYRSYENESATEQLLCNYGVNPEYVSQMIREPLRVSGIGPDGEIRVVELMRHRFYVATLFVPQLTSSTENPHPLIVDFVKAAKNLRY